MPLDPHADAWLQAMAAPGITLEQLPVADGRAALTATIEQCGGGAQEVADITDRTIPGPAGEIPVRVYTPDGSGLFPIIVFYHGGGWTLGSAADYDNVATRLANRAHAVVVSVDYRLAPEHPFPAAVDDAFAALQWVADHAGELNGDVERLLVAGDSAGGNLATVAALWARDHGIGLVAQVLIYPAVDFTRQTESYEQNRDGYFLTADLTEWFGDQYQPDPTDWRASPALAESLEGVAPAYIITAEFDPLRDEGEQYGQAIQDAGGSAQVHRIDGQIHGFVSMLAAIPAGAEVLDAAGLAVRDACRAGWRPQIWLQDA